MSIYDLPSSTGGMDETLTEVVAEVGTFIPGLLLFVFGFVVLTGMFAQKRRTGYSDLPMWFTMGSFSTLMVTLIMTMKDGLVNIEVLGVVIAITLFSGLWLFLSRGRGEI